MTDDVSIWVCELCGHAVFPRLLLCPLCGSDRWHEQPAARGVLEQATLVHPSEESGTRVGSVRTEAGPVVIARLLGDAEPGTVVTLWREAGVVAARRAS